MMLILLSCSRRRCHHGRGFLSFISTMLFESKRTEDHTSKIHHLLQDVCNSAKMHIRLDALANLFALYLMQQCTHEIYMFVLIIAFVFTSRTIIDVVENAIRQCIIFFFFFYICTSPGHLDLHLCMLLHSLFVCLCI